ncbi:aldose 1-epimerase [Ammoniphilus resinae]|uniref:Galactose mutarotase-like enzyme n=1 Tax=Ammoniphilus resinae TaxID=861532 RepID=A0ABS4GW28_9BACL|nr:galactose mutarotase-like enzyme [Ammoniphilus resinae]
MSCRINETTIEEVKAVILENDHLKITVLVSKGADIYEFIYKPKNIDVLWKAPWGIKNPRGGIATAENSQVAWMEHYEGGWQEIFPSGGGPCQYKGVEMNFHGELSTLPWKYKITANSEKEISVLFTVTTFRSPFTVERVLTLKENDPRLYIHEKVTNHSEEEMDYSWGHHPALGAPFLDEGVILDVPAEWFESQNRENESTRLPQKTRFQWPQAQSRSGETIDLSVLPSKQNRSADLAFLGGLEEGWYGVTNPKLGFGFGMVWPKGIFPYLWFWQELRGSSGYPWYSSNYVMALEPFTSYDESGLAHCVENGTARKLAPGESIEVDLIALCFESSNGVKRIDHKGDITPKDN